MAGRGHRRALAAACWRAGYSDAVVRDAALEADLGRFVVTKCASRWLVCRQLNRRCVFFLSFEMTV